MQRFVEIGFMLIFSGLVFGSCHHDAGKDDDEGSLDPDVAVVPGLTDDPEIQACDERTADPEYQKTLDALAIYLQVGPTCRELLPSLRVAQKIIITDAELTNTEVFAYARGVRFVDLSRNRLQNLTGFAKNEFLQQLYLNDNLIESIQGLPEVFPELELLELSGNPLGTAIAVSEENCPMAKVKRASGVRNECLRLSGT